MVKVEGPYRLKKGRFEDNFLVFELEGVQCIREWTSLTGERVKRDPAFARTRASYERMAKASPIASAIYWQLPEAMRIDGFFDAMVGVVTKLIKEGYTPGQARDILYQAVMSERCTAACTIEEDAFAIASSVYWQLPVAMRMDSYLYAMIGEVIGLLQEGFTTVQAYEILYAAAMPGEVSEKATKAGRHEEVILSADISFVEAMLKKVFRDMLAESAEYAEMRIDNKEMMCSDMPP